MKKLTNTKKITLATLKAFAKRNEGKLYAKTTSRFDGMVDCVMPNKNAKWSKTEATDDRGYYTTGIQGIYTVGSSRDYFSLYNDGEYCGIEVYNSCGTTVLAVKIAEKKQPDLPEKPAEIIKYSDKAIAVRGNTYPIKEQLKEIGARFNRFLKNDDGSRFAGWILPKHQEEAVRAIL